MKNYIFLFFISICNLLNAQNHNWVKTNPGGGGAFNVVKAGPTGTIYVGSDLSGLYISQDSGLTFNSIGAKQGLTNPHIGGLGLDPNNPNKFFIGTAIGLYKTDDGGLTVNKIISNGYISDIIICKNNPNYIYVSWHSNYNTIDGQIYRSVDGGVSFSKVGNLTANLRIIKLIEDPTDFNTVYFISGNARSACSEARLYKSINAGVDFVDISNGLGEILDMDIDPLSPNVLYMTTINAQCGSPYYYLDRKGKFYKSTDGGVSWILKSNVTGGIFVKKDNPSIIRRIDPRNTASWNTDSGTWESQDGGSSWTKIGNVLNWETGYQKDVSGATNDDITVSYTLSMEGIIKGFGVDFSNANVILWADEQWVFRSNDGGMTFKNIFTKNISPGWWQSTGLDNVNMMDIEINEANNNVIYAGYFDIGFWRSLNGGASWQSSNNPTYSGNWNGFGGNVATILSDPSRDSVVWTSMSQNQLGQSPTYLLKSTKFGQRDSWILSNTGLPTNEVMGLSIDRNSPNQNRTLFITANGFLYKSIDDGASWSKLSNGLPSNGGLRFTAVDNFNSNIVYVGGGNGLFGSIDAGNSWQMIGTTDMNSGGSLDFWPQTKGQGVFDIFPDPLESEVVYVVVYGNNKGLYKGQKTNNIWNWTKLYTDNFMRKVGVQPNNNKVIYASSSSAFTDGWYHPNSKGVIYSNDGFLTSNIVNGNLSWPYAMQIALTNEKVFIGSPGNGIYSSVINGSNLPLATISLSGTIQNNQNIIYWNTIDNPNIKYFDLEKSTDGFNFNAIKTNIQNESNMLKPIIITDENPFNCINYYRVNICDIDNYCDKSEIISIDNRKEETNYLYPNPIIDYGILRLQDQIGQMKVQIFNQLGILEFENVIDLSKPINLSYLKDGFYILKIVGTKQIFKFVKSN